MPESRTTLGVAITAFESAQFISDCLSSLRASTDVDLRVVVVDNASTDDTCEAIRQWAGDHLDAGQFTEATVGEKVPAGCWLTLLRAPINGGFAYGTNRALELLLEDRSVDLFWVLNPDCEVMPDTAATYARAGHDGEFALMGGRTLYAADRDIIQTDGGRVSRWTGVCQSVNLGQPVASTPPPTAQSLDFITGANCVASRQFMETAGLMEEDYFLYYEEVDWAMRRGALPLRLVPEARVHHLAGASIGSGTHKRRASAFANYFNYRNRMRFLCRFNPAALPTALAFASAKAMQLAMKGGWSEAGGLLRGALGLPPSRAVRERLSPDAQGLAFGPRTGAINAGQNAARCDRAAG